MFTSPEAFCARMPTAWVFGTQEMPEEAGDGPGTFSPCVWSRSLLGVLLPYLLSAPSILCLCKLSRPLGTHSSYHRDQSTLLLHLPVSQGHRWPRTNFMLVFWLEVKLPSCQWSGVSSSQSADGAAVCVFCRPEASPPQLLALQVCFQFQHPPRYLSLSSLFTALPSGSLCVPAPEDLFLFFL